MWTCKQILPKKSLTENLFFCAGFFSMFSLIEFFQETLALFNHTICYSPLLLVLLKTSMNLSENMIFNIFLKESIICYPTNI